MAYCELTTHEALELVGKGKTPDCRQHEHLPASEAKSLCENSQAYLVARGRIVRNTEMEWTGAKSEGFSVMQLRPVYRGKRRNAGNHNTPCGKHRAPRCKVLGVMAQ